VFPVKELVNYGLGLENPPSVKRGAVHLSAKDYHEKLKEVSGGTDCKASPLGRTTLSSSMFATLTRQISVASLLSMGELCILTPRQESPSSALPYLSSSLLLPP
jgi:hypothetical protein